MAELHAMAYACERAEWDRAAVIAATIHNVNCKPGDKIRNPETLNPYRRGPAAAPMSLKDLRRATER